MWMCGRGRVWHRCVCSKGCGKWTECAIMFMSLVKGAPEHASTTLLLPPDPSGSLRIPVWITLWIPLWIAPWFTLWITPWISLWITLWITLLIRGRCCMGPRGCPHDQQTRGPLCCGLWWFHATPACLLTTCAPHCSSPPPPPTRTCGGVFLGDSGWDCCSGGPMQMLFWIILTVIY